jgi:hypothetical protein
VHGRRLGDGAWTTRPLGAAWGPYFPGVPADERDTHAYPRPLSPAFWGAYAEPLGHFLSAAALFADAVGALGAARRGGTGHAGAERAFASLAAGVQATLGVGPGGRERAWRTKSLLGAFAVMAYLDLAAGWRVVGCGVCGAPFAAGGYQTLYCSARCRNTAVKRAYRRRLRGRAARAHSPGLAR